MKISVAQKFVWTLDRLQVVALKDVTNTPVLVIVNVYMPHFQGGDHQTEEFARTLDLLQNIIGSYSGKCLLKVLGDLIIHNCLCHQNLINIGIEKMGLLI